MATQASIVTDTELEVLKVLWEQEPLTVREISQHLYGKETTSLVGAVQKLIARLEGKAFVNRDRTDAIHKFTAAVTREKVAGMQLSELAEKLSDGSFAPFVLHLVQAKRLSAKEKEMIRRLLDGK